MIKITIQSFFGNPIIKKDIKAIIKATISNVSK